MEIPPAFFELYDGLPQQGPGSDELTLEALRRLLKHRGGTGLSAGGGTGILPVIPSQSRTPDRGGTDILSVISSQAHVLDIGCGTGRQTLVLARNLDAKIEAVDFHQPYLDALDDAARKAGLDHLIATRRADMAALDYPPGGFDMIWSEGAIYIIGFAEGLRRWRPLLKPAGLVAVTEITWLVESPPAEVVAFWRAAYPGITGTEDNVRAAQSAGYDLLDHFALPQAAWWDGYYNPLLERIARFKPGADAEMLQVITETEQEIEMFRRFGNTYGYVFYLMKRSD